MNASAPPDSPATGAYCWPQSGAPGDDIEVFISTADPLCSVEIVRVGATEQRVHYYEEVPTQHQACPSDVALAGCRWEPTLSITVDSEWTSGFYLVRVVALNEIVAEAFFVVKAAEPGDMILVLSTSTWAAYNDWGGPSFYTGGHVSSLERPLPKGFLSKPDPHHYRAANVRYLESTERRSHFATYSPWSIAAGYANWEAIFVAWAESEGLSFDYATSLDLAAEPALLDPYRVYLSVGHDEYWDGAMRDHVEGWVDRGGWAVFMSGNTSFWQTRYENDYRRVVGYKQHLERDPVFGTPEEHTLSTMWADPLVGRPEAEMTGVSFTRGGYARMMNSPEGTGGYSVWQPEHWVFDGLDVDVGDVVGSAPPVVGYECDGCELTSIDGIPHAVPSGGTPPNFTVLGTAPARLWETAEVPSNLDDSYVGELNWVAARLAGHDAAETRALFEDGHAVLGCYERGAGHVFTTGCTDWAYGLNNPSIATITKNVLRRGLERP